jgi:hypothetical protein
MEGIPAAPDTWLSAIRRYLAVIAVGSSAWPRERFLPVAVAAMALGLGYTAFSEWLNIGVRRAWPYSDLMPVLAWFGMALSSVSVVGNALRLRTAKL